MITGTKKTHKTTEIYFDEAENGLGQNLQY